MQATYEEAKKICQKDNMAISSLDTPEEKNKISEYLNYIGK